MKFIALASFFVAVAAPGLAAVLDGTTIKRSYPPGVTATVVENIPSLYLGLKDVEVKNVSVLGKRATPGVFFCVDGDFTGHCVHIVATSGICVDLGSDLDDQVSAIGPDMGFSCDFFNDVNCQTDQSTLLGVEFPGIKDLSQFDNGVFNDVISSYKC